MALNSLLPFRIAQAVLAIVILGLTAWVAHYYYYPYGIHSNNFLLFTSIWTLLALVYLMMAQGRYTTGFHRISILVVEGLTTIFWFAGFIAVAVFIGRGDCGRGWGGPCKAEKAAVVLGAIEWVLFMITMILSALNINKDRGVINTKHTPAVNTGGAVV